MTVPAEAPTVPDVDPALAAMFAAQYQRNWRMLCGYLAFRLDVRHAHLAEDMAQEVFLRIWRSYVLPGKLQRPDRLWPLLRLTARSVLGDFYETKASRDRSLDFADPVNTPIVSTGHAYAGDVPALAGLVAELDAAMEHMTACSQAWRDLHKETYTLRGRLDDDYMAYRGGLTEDAKARTRARLAEADREEESALETFSGACQRVGQLRAEIEAEAGVNWRSAVGMPVDPEPTVFRKGSYRNDRSVTHCPEGHLLDTANTHFGEDGSRRCRACGAEREQQHKMSRRGTGTTGRTKRDTVADDAVATIRKMLADPAHADTPLADIAASVGCSKATLIRRIPDRNDLRRAAKAKAANMAADR